MKNMFLCYCTDKVDIVLTGSVVLYRPDLPKGVLRNTEERMLDYLCAIRLWLGHPNIRSVVYCDSGNYRFPEELIADDRFESLAVDLIDLCVKQGCGAAECESIRYAMEKSHLLGQKFFKCTGRLYVTNFNQIVRATRPEGRFLYLNKSDKLKEADSRFYGIDKEYFLESVIPTVTMMRDRSGKIVERVFYQHVHQYCLFPLPHIMGRSGYTGKYYDTYFPDPLIDEVKRSLGKIKIPEHH